jgi:hypothetical protein
MPIHLFDLLPMFIMEQIDEIFKKKKNHGCVAAQVPEGGMHGEQGHNSRVVVMRHEV